MEENRLKAGERHNRGKHDEHTKIGRAVLEVLVKEHATEYGCHEGDSHSRSEDHRTNRRKCGLRSGPCGSCGTAQPALRALHRRFNLADDAHVLDGCICIHSFFCFRDPTLCIFLTA